MYLCVFSLSEVSFRLQVLHFVFSNSLVEGHFMLSCSHPLQALYIENENNRPTVAVKKTLPFPLPSVPFVRLQNGAGTDCKCRLAPSVPFHSFPAVVYWARQQALYCGMGASTTGSTI